MGVAANAVARARIDKHTIDAVESDGISGARRRPPDEVVGGSDHYAAYDSINCPQQKCLIHLLRDMNQDLLNNPFDEELQSVTSPFGVLLREVVTTIDVFDFARIAAQQSMLPQDPKIAAASHGLVGGFGDPIFGNVQGQQL
jgi:hypothetical protein